jgi:2-C-methyl-D-erythritol 4-phosphate cytidylyltransferase
MTPVGMSSAGVIGVILLREDDPAAPSGCSGLRERDGVPLVLSAWRSLAGHVARTVVLVPAALEPGAREALTRAGGVDVRVVATGSSPPSWRTLVAPDTREEQDGWAVVHEPVFARVPPDLLTTMLARARDEGLEAVIPVHPVTDTLKRVDGAGRIVGTVDRDDYRVACTPQVYRIRSVPDVPASAWSGPGPVTGPRGVPAGAGTESLAAGIRTGTERVVLVPAPAALSPVGTSAG